MYIIKYKTLNFEHMEFFLDVGKISKLRLILRYQQVKKTTPFPTLVK